MSRRRKLELLFVGAWVAASVAFAAWTWIQDGYVFDLPPAPATWSPAATSVFIQWLVVALAPMALLVTAIEVKWRREGGA